MSENRLGRETSPYLLQHQDNPVHWWAWGPEALAEAKRTSKPILLSVGYAACHWCHVMAHESFEDAPTAAVMNELFVNIKVDREERPDIDAIYMRALASPRRAGRLAAHHVPRQRRAAVLGRHLFPEGAALRPARPSSPSCARSRASTAASPTRSATTPACSDRGPRRRQRRPAGPAQHRRCRAQGPHHAHGRRRRHHARRSLRGAPKFPQWSFFWLLWRGGIRFDLPASRARSRPRSPTSARAASTIISAAASRATPSTTAGSCRTSRRCSTTTRC